MLISVLICTYNRCESLKDTLESLRNQSTDEKFDYEIIVIDNNSNDKTKEVVDSYLDKFNVKLRYIFESEQGVSFARNVGVREARGEIVAFTDDDVRVPRNWISKIVQLFDVKGIDIAGGKVIPIFSVEKPKWLNEEISRGPLAHYSPANVYFENEGSPIFLVGANLFFRKSSYFKFGGFSIGGGRGEDTDLVQKWHTLGAKIAYDPDIIVYHSIEKSRLTKKYFRKWYFLGGKNNSLIFRDKFTKGRLFLSTPLWVYKELLIYIFKFLKGALFLDKDIFLYEIIVWYNLGIIFGLKGLKTNFESLR